MANAVVNRQVNVYINSGEAAKAYDVLIKREKLLNAELAKTTDPKRIKLLNGELEKLKDPIDRAAKKMRGELAPSIRELEIGTRKFLNEWKKTGDPETLRKFQAFRAELTQAKAQMNDLGAANQGLTSVGIFKGAFWANLAAGAISGFFGSMKGFLTDSLDEAIAAEENLNRLKGTLDNLGQSDVLDRLTQKAQEMADRFRYLDNDDVIAVFEKLIDYGKLTEKEMNDLLPTIINFAAKSRISLEEATGVVVKALEGNGKALKQYGIDIKDAGTEAERLAIIQTTLKEKVEGAADAFQNSTAGGVAIAKQRMADLKEEIGTGLIPIFRKLLEVTNEVVRGISTVFGFRSFLDDTIKGIATNPQVLAQSNREFEIKKNFIMQDIEFAKKKGVDKDGIKKIITEYVTELQKQKSVVDATIKRSVAEGVFNGGDQSKINVALDAVSKQLALQKLISEFSASDKVLGLGDSPDKPGKETPEKKIKKVENAWKEFYEMLERGRKVARDAGKDNDKLLASVDKLMKTQIDAAGATGIDPANRIARFDRNRVAGLDLKVLTSRGKEKLKAELALLKEQERQELDNKNLTENEKLLIEEQYRLKRKEAENSFLGGFIDNLVNYANQALQVLSLIGQAQTDKENQELENNRRINDKKKNNLDQRLKKGLISQLQYDREIQKMEAEQEKREKVAAIKQFRRKQQEAIFSAVINNAQGITKTIAENGFPKAIPFIVAQGIVFLAQMAAIAKQKPPEFAQGGLLGGRSHSAGGNAVIDGSGRKIAEVEAGEGIVNKRTMADGRRYSVSGTPSQIISRLNGMYGSSWEAGATLIPGWRSYSPQRMNYSAMKRMYADGGVMSSNTGNQGADNSVFENLTAMISDMQSTQAYLASVLADGIVADVSLNRFEQQQQRLVAIRRDATLRG